MELAHFCLCWFGLAAQRYSSACLHFNKNCAGLACSVNVIQIIAVTAHFSFVALDDKVTTHSMCGVIII